MKNKLFFLFLLTLVTLSGHAQISDFQFRRKIQSVDSPRWSSITLPANIFKHLNNSFSDLRILKVAASDTTEVPYLLKINQPTESELVVALNVVNQSTKGKTQYFTFKNQKGDEVNFLDLSFEETNYDGFVTLEGSNGQREWFSIVKKQRIISIDNDDVHFTSGTLRFPTQVYKSFRLQAEADKALTLKNASFKKRQMQSGKTGSPHFDLTEVKNKPTKQSVFTLTLDDYQPVVSIRVQASEESDYYRPFRLERLADSSQSPKGWEYFYETITSGVLTSLDSNSFHFNAVLSRKLRLIIDNGDNAFLNVKAITLASPEVELTARLAPGDNFLYYGNSKIGSPNYDLVHFQGKVPERLSTTSLEKEEQLIQQPEVISPLVRNKMWLWVIMAVVIGVLGFFTLKMMKSK